MEKKGTPVLFLFKILEGHMGEKMSNRSTALDIYLNYCRNYITNTAGLKDWLLGIRGVFISKQYLFVTSGKDLCKYRMIQGIENMPLLQFVEKTSIHCQSE